MAHVIKNLFFFFFFFFFFLEVGEEGRGNSFISNCIDKCTQYIF